MLKTLTARVHSLTDRAAWLAPLALRIVLGVAFIKTGWGKLNNLDRVEKFFTSLDIPAAHIQAPMVAGIEFVGGLLLLVGLGTRLAAALLVSVMAVAIYTAIWPEAAGWTEVLGGIEAIYLVAFLHLALTGGGAISLDRALTRWVPGLAPPRAAAPVVA
ncbi:MAG: DoxX family protein [Kofleriaceae bacterium]|jgi:putative oxidoreductase|nr:DoxX family protein [Kofleriaceae bacterium]MBP9168699.1 DoxX family protein [Kofleriaceae bacterium]MBP9862967.1 DoxX family protein [Kofleriaceae bacterium]